MPFELKSLIAKLNPKCRSALESAAELCVSQTHFNVELEHLLVKLMEIPDTDISRLFARYGVDRDRAAHELTEFMGTFKRGNSRTPALSPHILTLLEEAWLLSSLKLDSQQIRSGAIVQALVDNEALRAMMLESCRALSRIPRESLAHEIREIIAGSGENGNGAPSPVKKTPEPDPRADEKPKARAGGKSKTPNLDLYTLDLTAEAAAGRLDPVQGRDAEIRQIIDILMRRRQNNPILTGDAGVGKTAIVEGFARRIAQGRVPEPLKNVTVRTLDLGLLQAGAGIKGEFENRLKSVIAEIKGLAAPVILFIDEAHVMIGAGGTAGLSDAASLLKPVLARGELRTIAATTWAEYKKYFEKDSALTRRFQVVKVDEPDEAQCTDILRVVADNLESHHDVRILDEAVRDSVRLASRYITGRKLPDKAISLLDTAAARVAIGQTARPPALEDVVHHIQHMTVEINILTREQAAGLDHAERIKDLTDSVNRRKKRLEELEDKWKKELDLVSRIRELQGKAQPRKSGKQPRPGKRDELARLTRELEDIQGDSPMVPVCVDSKVVAEVVAGWTGIPVGRIMKDELKTVLSLKEEMEKHIIGQSRALSAISSRIRTYRADITDPGKPVGVFLLVGPSGVGKTETAITLAELLYGGEKNLVCINMSEYQEAHTVSGLKGAPPGYVGYGQGGILTEAVRRRPYSVVLLDEIEKAHPDVMELFYQVFDKGRLEDAEGQVVNFRNTIIIMTSNLGHEMVMNACADENSRPSPRDLADMIRPVLSERFSSGFLGRLEVVPYYPLSEGDIRRIVGVKLDKLKRRFENTHNAVLDWDPGVMSAIAERCTEVSSGARNIDYILNHNLLPGLSREVLVRMALARPFSAARIRMGGHGDFAFELTPGRDVKTEPGPDRASSSSARAGLAGRDRVRQDRAADASDQGAGGQNNAPGMRSMRPKDFKDWKQWYDSLSTRFSKRERQQ